MASPIIIPKKSTIAGKVPLPEQLSGGEVCVNWADQVWQGKHPTTNGVVPIGAPAIHSHDELYSLDQTKHLELQNNGTLLLNGSTTLTLPSASGTLATLADITAGQQADWNATSGTAQILNKPTLGTAAATNSTAYATAAQGAKADSALQASALTPYRTSAAQDTIDAGKVSSNTTGIANTTPITNMMQITLGGYNSITPAANTLYIIVG